MEAAKSTIKIVFNNKQYTGMADAVMTNIYIDFKTKRTKEIDEWATKNNVSKTSSVYKTSIKNIEQEWRSGGWESSAKAHVSNAVAINIRSIVLSHNTEFEEGYGAVSLMKSKHTEDKAPYHHHKKEIMVKGEPKGHVY